MGECQDTLNTAGNDWRHVSCRQRGGKGEGGKMGGERIHLLDSSMARLFSLRVSVVAMPTLMLPVATASNKHCGTGLVAPAGVHAALASSLAAASMSAVKVGTQSELWYVIGPSSPAYLNRLSDGSSAISPGRKKYLL